MSPVVGESDSQAIVTRCAGMSESAGGVQSAAGAEPSLPRLPSAEEDDLSRLCRTTRFQSDEVGAGSHALSPVIAAVPGRRVIALGQLPAREDPHEPSGHVVHREARGARPRHARADLDAVAELVDCPMGIISVGPDRERTITLTEPYGA